MMSTQIPQHEVTGSHAHESAPTAPSRRREMVCDLLTQIFVLAERTRVAKQRSIPDAQAEPISLIELIQASSSVFERYGIGPPDDALYQRYLLSLSIHKEKNWRKKIASFDFNSQPTIDSFRNAAADGQRDRKHNVVRRASFVSEPSPPVTNLDSRSFRVIPKQQLQLDLFSDMLSLESPIQRLPVADDSQKTFTKTRRLVPMYRSASNAEDGEQSDDLFPLTAKPLEMMTTSIEQWRAAQAVKQLMTQSKAQDVQTHKQQVVTRCTHAIFHWIAHCLPEKLNFQLTESPRALPLCILRRIRVNVKVLKKSARNVWTWQMKTLLNAWHREAQKVAAFRVRRLVKQRAEALETTFHCLQSWRFFTETKKCLTARAQWVAQRCSRSRLRTCLERWRRVFRSREQQTRVVRRRSRRLQHQILTSWQELVQSKRDERSRFDTARKRRVLARWKSDKERKQASRALLCIAADQCRLRVLSSWWIKLRINVSHHVTTRARVHLWGAICRQRRCQAVVRGWRLAVKQHKSFHERDERFRRYIRRRHLRQNFIAWAACAQRQVAIINMLSDRVKARVSKLLSLYFAHWKTHWNKVSDYEEALVICVTSTRRKKVWEYWRRSTGTRNATRCLNSVYSWHLVAKFFTHWEQHTAQKIKLHLTFLKCQQRHRLTVLALHWKLLVTNLHLQYQKQDAVEHFGARKALQLRRICLAAWREHVHDRRACELRGQELRHSTRRRWLINSVWSKWSHAFWLRTAARLADKQLQRYRQSHCFSVWKQVVHAARQRRERALQVVAMLLYCHFRQCFLEWRRLQAAKHKLVKRSEVTRQLVRTRTLATRWEAWRHALEMKRGQYERLCIVTCQWQKRQLWTNFQSWKTIWCSRKRHHQLLHSTLRMSKRKVVEAHFHAWRLKFRTSVARELAVHETQEKLLRFKVKRAIRWWHSHHVQQLEHSHLVVKALAYWRQTLVSRAFTRFLKYKQLRKRLRTAIIMSYSHVKSAAFAQWQTFLTQRHCKHQVDAVRAVTMTNFRVHRRIRRWKEKVQARKLLKLALTHAVRTSTASIMQRHVMNWRRFVARQVRMRVLKQKAAAFRSLCLLPPCFGAWKTFQSRNKYKQERMRRASGLWSHQNERRVFKVWVLYAANNRRTKCAVAKWRNETFARRFTTWKRFESLQKKKQLDRLRAIKCYERRICYRVLKNWRGTSRHDRVARQRWNQNVSCRVLTEWRRVVVSRQQSRQWALCMANRAKLTRLRVIWSHWRTKTRVFRCVEGLRGKATANRVTSDLRLRFRRWKQFTLVSLGMNELRRRQKTELVRKTFLDGFQRYTQLQRKERALTTQIACVHDAFLNEWLAMKLHQRMSSIAACEDMRRTGNLKRLLGVAWGGWIHCHRRIQSQQVSICQLRGEISRLDEQNRRLNRTKLCCIFYRWRSLKVARVMERWRDVTQIQKRVRLYTLKAIEWWHKTQCGRVFHAWTRFCRLRTNQRRIRAMNVKYKLKRTWQRWQTFTTASLSEKTRTRSVHEFHLMWVYRNNLKTWREATSSLHVRRHQLLELYHSSRLRLLAVLFKEWQKFAAMEKTERVQKTVSRVVHEQNLTRRSFSVWRLNVAGICYHRRHLQINTERLQVLMLCSSFRAWRSWSKHHKKLKSVAHILSTKCNSKVAFRVFTAWHTHAEKTSGIRHEISSFLHFRRMQNGVKALRNLVHEQKYQRNFRQKAERFRTAGCGKQVLSIFTRWRKLAVLARKTRAVTLRYLQEKLLPSVWGAWIMYVKTQRDTKTKILAATRSWTNASLRKTWNALVRVFIAGKRRQTILARADFHFRNRRLDQTLKFWRQLSKESQHFRAISDKFLIQWKCQTTYRCFRALHGHAITSKTLRTSEKTVTSRVRATAMLRTWYAWRKLMFISRSGKRQLLQRHWAAWVRSQASRRMIKTFQEHFEAQMLKNFQRRCVTNWKQFVATRKLGKARRLLSTAFAGTRSLQRVWICWMKSVAQTRAAKLRMRNALMHMRRQRQFKVFRALQTHTSLQKWKTHVEIRVQSFRSQRLSAHFFLRWQSVITEQIQRRQTLENYLNVMQCSVQKQNFGIWGLFVARRKLWRFKVSQSLAKRTQSCGRIVFQTWKSLVAKVHRNRLAQGFCAAKVSTHAIKYWKQYVVLCKIERMIGTSGLRQLESSFLSWRKVVTATHRIRAFRAKNARKHWLELVGIVFTSWKQRSRTRTHCRTLLINVAMGHQMRFRFMLWQQFTAQRKRLRDLLLMVKGEAESAQIPTFQRTALGHSQEHEVVSLGQELAKKARILQRFEVTWDLPQTWHRWRQIFHAQRFYRIRRLQLHFICWQRLAHQQRRHRFIVNKLTNHRRATLAQTSFRAWAELVARVKQLQRERHRERELWVVVNTEMARRERRELKNHWHAWQFHVEETRHLHASLDAYYRARLLTKFWLLWCHDFRLIMSDSRRDRQRLDTHMRGFHLRRALRSLKKHHQRSKRARLVLEYFDNRRYDMLLPELLAQWRKWCQHRKEVAHRLEAARMNRTRRHLTTWQIWKNTQKWQKVAVNNFQAKSVDHRRRRVWRRWRGYAKNRVVTDLALHKAVIFHVCSRLRKRWLRHTQRARQLCQQAETAKKQLGVYRGHRAMSRWRDFSQTRRLRRLCQRFVLRKHVQLWQSAVKLAVASRFDDFLLRSKTKKMVIAWHQIAARQQRWRQLYASFVGNKQLQTVRRVFRRWQQLVNTRQGQRLAAMYADQTLLRTFWRRWDRATLTSQLERYEQLELAAKHEAEAMLRQNLRVWRAAVKKQRERRFVLLACVVKLESVAGQRAQEVVFRAWRRVVEHKRRSGAALVRHDRNTAKKALSCWSNRTNDRQRRRQQLGNAAGYHSQRLKSVVFFYWQTYVFAWQDAVKSKLIAKRHDRQMTRSVRSKAEGRDFNEYSDESEEEGRRPTSPVMKRLRQKKANRTKPMEDANDSSEIVTLPDAMEISMDVKKRLLLLGKWKPQWKDEFRLQSTSTCGGTGTRI